MLEMDKQKHSHERIEYLQIAMEDFKHDSESFDVVLSSLTFHYVKDYEELISHISKWIKKGEDFGFSVEHPVLTVYGAQDWYYDENGNIFHFPIDRYYEERQHEALSLGEKVVKYRHILST